MACRLLERSEASFVDLLLARTSIECRKMKSMGEQHSVVRRGSRSNLLSVSLPSGVPHNPPLFGMRYKFTGQPLLLDDEPWS